jgi:hypothetical protein
VTVYVAAFIVIAVGLDETAEKPSAAALVAVTVQVPALVAERLVPLIVQPVVPAEVTAYETEPFPLPPLVVSANVDSAAPVVDVIVNAAWFSRP